MNPRLWVTTFESLTKTKGKRHEIDWSQLVELCQKPKRGEQLMKLGTFFDNSRAANGRGVEMIYGVEGDYDAGGIGIDEAHRRLTVADVCAVLYTTKSHNPEAPRWRVLAPLSGPVAPAERAGLLDRLNAALGGCLARESWDVPRVFFYRQPPAAAPYVCIPVDGSLTVDQLPAVESAQEAPERRQNVERAAAQVTPREMRWDALQAGADVHANVRGLVAGLIRGGVPADAVAAFVAKTVIPQVEAARGPERAAELLSALPRLIEGAASKYRPETGTTEAGPPPGPELSSLRVRSVAEKLMQTPDSHPGTVPLPGEWGLIAKALDQNTGTPKLPRGIHVFAGQTGCGKTQLATGFTRAALLAGHPVVYLSLELSPAEVTARLLALETSHAEDSGGRAVGWPLLAQGAQLAPVQRKAVKEARDTLGDALDRLYVWAPDPKPGDPPASVDALRGLVREAWKTDGKIPLVVVDHLQAPGLALDATPQSARLPLRERVAGIIMALRHVSKEDEDGWPGCPVVVLSLVARHITAGAGHVPGFDGGDPDRMRLATLETLKAIPKEAGEIEATAVTLWAMASAQPNEGETKSRMTLRLAKSRMTRAGKWIPLEMEGFTGRLRDDERRYEIAKQEDKRAADEKRRKAENRRKAQEAGGDA